MTSPTHTVGGSAATSWTTRNLGEAMPGVCTPLSWTYFETTVEHGLRHGFRDLGALRSGELVPSGVDDSFIAPFFGRTAMNLSMMGAMADRTPGSSATAVETQLIGTIREGTVDVPTRTRYPVIAVRGPVVMATVSRRCRTDRARAERWYPDALGRLQRDPAAAHAVLAESIALIRPVLRTHIIVAMLANPMFDAVSALARRADSPGLESVLLSGLDTEEVGLGVDLWALGNGVLSEPDFLTRHGHHGPGGLHVSGPSWREQPAPLRVLAQGYAGIPDHRRPRAVLAERSAARREAMTELLSGLPARHRPVARLALRGAGHFLPLRELGRSTWVRLLDGGRAAVRILGERLVADGVLDAADDVTFCTVGELLDGPGPDIRDTVMLRGKQFGEYESVELPPHWSGDPVPVAPRRPVAGPVELVGVAVGGGVVEGTARVVTEPGADAFEPGEILVCAATDPGWVSLFLLAEAVVVDTGGALSHGAIVARELGIPAVTNTGDASRRIRSGDRVRVDADAGTVRVLGP